MACSWLPETEMQLMDPWCLLGPLLHALVDAIGCHVHVWGCWLGDDGRSWARQEGEDTYHKRIALWMYFECFEDIEKTGWFLPFLASMVHGHPWTMDFDAEKLQGESLVRIALELEKLRAALECEIKTQAGSIFTENCVWMAALQWQFWPPHFSLS